MTLDQVISSLGGFAYLGIIVAFYSGLIRFVFFKHRITQPALYSWFGSIGGLYIGQLLAKLLSFVSIDVALSARGVLQIVGALVGAYAGYSIGRSKDVMKRN